MAILEVKQLSKQFNSHSVIQNVSFSVPDGCIFGFLGQNGAGKTTMMKMILGLLKPSEGEIYVCGERVSYGETEEEAKSWLKQNGYTVLEQNLNEGTGKKCVYLGY
ncbi:MAG: ATP-binding cassette domain-containing protein, partial [Turicibacter sp.]|nr:ATP-binding cassette domain-containing protein [Turicibacter sp.]